MQLDSRRGGRRHIPASAEAAAWATVHEAVRAGVLDERVVAHVRTTQPEALVALLEFAGQAALERGNDSMAERLYVAAVGVGSSNAEVQYNLGNIAGRAGQPRKAIDSYTKALQLDPDLRLAYYNRGLQRRALGDEAGARSDISTAIAKGYGPIEVYSALFRGRSREFGAPAEAFEEARMVSMLLARGDAELALIMASASAERRRTGASRAFRDQLALVVALQSRWNVIKRFDDIEAAVQQGQELVDVCRALAEAQEWTSKDAPLKGFVVGELPHRLGSLVSLYAASGRHDLALATASEAFLRCGGPGSGHPAVARLFNTLAGAVYSEMRRRALSYAARLRVTGKSNQSK